MAKDIELICHWPKLGMEVIKGTLVDEYYDYLFIKTERGLETIKRENVWKEL